ncbi:MAG: SRPBCC family protein [Anaerolineae bacterium]|jgi:ribosome-associated toxin RatA of RatAB toxin-antitoxin module
MARIEESVSIAASPSSVFRLCHDIARRPEWDGRVVGVELLTPAPLRRGSLVRIEAGRAGKFLFSWDAEYVSYQFPSGSILKVLDAAPSSPFNAGTESWQIEKSPDGARFTLVWEYKPRGFAARIADALGRRAATRRAIRRSLDNLKSLAES